MSGTTACAIVVPIVALICLAFLLTCVYYANSHPEWRHHTAEANEPATHRESITGPPPGPAGSKASSTGRTA